MQKKSVRDLDVDGKKVLVRVDFNVPVKDGEVTDDTRIDRAMPTIGMLVERGAKVALISHLGRPKGSPDPKYAMDPVAKRLGEMLGRHVEKLDTAVGQEVSDALDNLPEGGVVLLENSRFYEGETKNDPGFADELAAPFDLYVNDAFGAAHRAHATTVGVAERLPAAAGLLLEREVDYLDGVLKDPERPFVAILGGAKVSDKLGVIESLLGVADSLLIGGAMCFTFFKAKGYGVGKSLVEDDYLEEAKRLMQEAGDKLVLPVDVVAAREFEADAEHRTVSVDGVPEGWMGLDIGPETVELFAGRISGAKTVFWNGPMGVFEMDAFAKGTEGVARAVAESDATSVVGGGDSVAAVNKLGLEREMSHISTGGGASLEYVEGKELPGVAVLPDR
ncbi:3-phosphoglycerate kinase [Rubrobacter radiotolerans]|uniref:Phosphoglycerate kinase n=1 Tax=Rubrobacter radiotolerans TaxID=42256 RepID=A0A023X521_RUBRA|nr:phosphoglycerate kinase [Rubrobacter radiotolerans]AHY47065.1 3-phosphoglycerate kinase [Rubrobacter radiotolerans]MDX5894471.1 phosphoglycerate kinase [Rubrobacter radiotolerans]SMC06072.1 phosphoglycerate kinase [Rubrobacter radiotolerans DSM 5868]